MKRHEAIRVIAQHLERDDIIVSSTGNLSRELFLIAGHHHQIFYMMGSMGLASSIGFGLAICFPSRRIVVIEGDGSLLMNLGSMATIGHRAPTNLLHIVLDNEAYDSTGGQPSVSNTVHLDEIARATSYRIVQKVYDEYTLTEFLENNLSFLGNGPVFLQVKVTLGCMDERIPRIPYEPEEITNYFKEWIKKIMRPPSRRMLSRTTGSSHKPGGG